MTNSEPVPSAGDASGSIRIGDADRNAAVTALGEHMTTGRIDLDEYGTRSALANNARTVGDLRALFADLPAPHPVLPGTAGGPAPLTNRPPAMVADVGPGGRLATTGDDRSRTQKLVAAAAGASGIIALVLFFATGLWWWFLLVPLIATVASSVWGDGWKGPRTRD